jgi:hypothetical protein
MRCPIPINQRRSCALMSSCIHGVYSPPKHSSKCSRTTRDAPSIETTTRRLANSRSHPLGRRRPLRVVLALGRARALRAAPRRPSRRRRHVRDRDGEERVRRDRGAGRRSGRGSDAALQARRARGRRAGRDGRERADARGLRGLRGRGRRGRLGGGGSFLDLRRLLLEDLPVAVLDETEEPAVAYVRRLLTKKNPSSPCVARIDTQKPFGELGRPRARKEGFAGAHGHCGWYDQQCLRTRR